MEGNQIAESEELEINELVGQVVRAFIQEGRAIGIQDIVGALHLMSTRTDDVIIRTRCRKAMRVLANKMH